MICIFFVCAYYQFENLQLKVEMVVNFTQVCPS